MYHPITLGYGYLNIRGFIVLDVYDVNTPQPIVLTHGDINLGGYVGLSHHEDGWHLGAPAFALSETLINAMNYANEE
jgi:hypothetical protein